MTVFTIQFDFECILNTLLKFRYECKVFIITAVVIRCNTLIILIQFCISIVTSITLYFIFSRLLRSKCKFCIIFSRKCQLLALIQTKFFLYMYCVLSVYLYRDRFASIRFCDDVIWLSLFYRFYISLFTEIRQMAISVKRIYVCFNSTVENNILILFRSKLVHSCTLFIQLICICELLTKLQFLHYECIDLLY